MADESEVEASLVSAIAASIYPSGTGASSVLLGNAPCRVFRGWPIEKNLKDDLASGIANVSIYPRNGVERNKTSYPREPVTLTRAPKTLIATVSGQTITIGGSISTPLNVLILAPHVTVNYAVQPSDTLTTIATGLSAALAIPFPGTTNIGPVITVVGFPGVLMARVAASGVQATEIRRIDKGFQVSLWAANPEVRDSLAKVVDPALTRPTFFTLPDGSDAWVKYDSTLMFDTPQEEGLYRRDLFYNVEFAMMDLSTDPEIGAGVVGATGGASPYPGVPDPQTLPSTVII